MENKQVVSGDAPLDEQTQVPESSFTQEERAKKIINDSLEKDTVNREELLPKLFKTKMQPLEDRIVVYPDPAERVTAGGILKPDEVVQRERPARGTVIAVGPGKDKPVDLKVGDRIIYGRFAGTGVDEPETKVEVLIMRPMDIFARL